MIIVWKQRINTIIRNYQIKINKNNFILRQIRRISLFACLVFILSFSLASASPTNLYVHPSAIEDSTLTPDRSFSVEVRIDDVPDLYAYEFKLYYDPSILNATGIDVSFLNEPTNIVKKDVDEASGIVLVAVASRLPAKSKSGSGTIAKINFDVKGKGECDLNLQDTKLASFSTFESISYESVDGHFNNKPTTYEPGPVYDQSCYDSDGLDYYTKGYVEFDSTRYYDKCVNEEVLIEGYCEEGYFKTKTYYCPSGCENGNCGVATTSTTIEIQPATPGGGGGNLRKPRMLGLVDTIPIIFVIVALIIGLIYLFMSKARLFKT